MSKNFKKYFSIVLAILMLVSIVPTQLFAVSVEDPWVIATETNRKNNVFLDALEYLGYDTSYFINNKKVGSSVPTSALSGITYNTGGATGSETTSAGKPNVSTFKSKGLCCASFVSYVYFNYLPNVYGLDVSFLTDVAVPSSYRSTTDWTTACEKWVSNKVATKTAINTNT